MKAKDLIEILKEHPEAEIINYFGIYYNEQMEWFMMEPDPEEGRR